ncbi:hypothetical protein [Nocardia sp. SC052]
MYSEDLAQRSWSAPELVPDDAPEPESYMGLVGVVAPSPVAESAPDPEG